MTGPWPRPLAAQPATADPTRGALPTELRVAGLLAAWGSAWLAGRATAACVRDTVGALLETQDVVWPQLATDPMDLERALDALARRGARRLLLACPVPGDPDGLPAAQPAGRAALEHGAAVVTEDGDLVLVPVLTVHGNDREGRVHTLRWTVHELSGGAPRAGGQGLAESSSALAEAVTEAAGTLTRLEVARWRPEVGAALDELRAGARRAHSPLPLPPDAGPRAQMLVDLAARLLAVVALGRVDDGAAVAAVEARERDEALRQVAAAARRALCAGVNADPRR
jgi:hypothetical protein